MYSRDKRKTVTHGDCTVHKSSRPMLVFDRNAKEYSLINQSINQSILYLLVEQSVTEYMCQYKRTHKIYKKKIERLAYSVQELNTYY